ncbi:dienelactone hydrolase family protein [Nocardia sp. NBC_01503]|uniref:dienelactone hydrolase family protein n=1 Tax=Nocardia sp. NBC_01503 TaxID=2975997 RepID=UPI002E7B6E4B|nr:dienelactone hydrolase family protein [Nocardia sp. NBC_01503]WTL33248.1 dienelactone hydrolase family protein [Nocardia sp. NBC_01503]
MSDTGIVTEWIDIEVGGAVMSAYLARPEAPGDYPGVIVGHEIYGQHESVLAAAERLAALGVTVLVPDLFHRAEPRARLDWTAEGRERGLDLLRTLNRADVIADISACIDELNSRNATTVGMVGFSAGGHVAYYAATQLPLTVVAAFYPGWLTNTEIPLSTPEPTIESTSGITGRVILFFGGLDPLIDAEARAELEKALSDNNIDHELVVYEDAPHGFVYPGRDWYRPEDAEDAWSRLVNLLRG